MNAIIFQVRPSGDALYNSLIEPWQYYLTEGKSPNPLWDRLEFVINEVHKRQIDVHAWINPYRALDKGAKYTLNSSHMAKRFV